MKKNLLLIATLLFLAIKTTTAQVLASDSLALVDFYNSTNMAQSSAVEKWDLSTPINTWYGINLNQRGTRVTGIYLSGYYIGPHPTLPNTLNTLTSLTDLSIISSNLEGSLPDLNGMTNLVSVSLSSANLTGAIPDLTSLTALTLFDVSNNNLSGNFPNISNLINLTTFNIGNNKISGNIPNLSLLTKLTTFYTNDNQISGVLPDLSVLSQLNIFDVHDNIISGNLIALPSQKMYMFNVSSNLITGNIPTLGSEHIYDVSNNLLEGDLPSSNKIDGFTVANNKFNFTNILSVLSLNQAWESNYNYYSPQKFFNLLRKNDWLIADTAGGIAANCTYTWSLNGNITATITGNDSFKVTEPGDYYVDVTDASVPGLTMSSNDFIVTSGSLPVHLISFTAVPTLSGNQLSWNTGVESNSKGFTIQASTNGRDFNDVDFISAKGSNSSYQYTDTHAYSSATIYYRLNEIDLDGSSSFSPVVSVKNDHPGNITVYPNPAITEITVTNMAGTIRVYNATGKLVLSQTAANSSTTLNVQPLFAGIYYVEDSAGNTAKFIKQ